MEVFHLLVLDMHLFSISQSAHTHSIGFRSYGWGGQVSTSKNCIDNHYYYFHNVFKIIIMLNMIWEKGWKWHNSIVFITLLWKMVQYKAIVVVPSILRVKPMSHDITQPHKNCTTSMFNCLTHMMSLNLRFSILHPTPSATIILYLIGINLIIKNILCQSLILQSWWC